MTAHRIATAYVRKPLDAPAAQASSFERMCYQHDMYCAALSRCGVDVKVLRSDPDFPQGSLISDLAVVTDNLAVIGNFAETSSRQGEQPAIAALLGGSRFLRFIEAPGRLDAGDVACIGGKYYIGLSDHTNQVGADQLRDYLREFGHEAVILNLDAENIIRLGSAVCDLSEDRILVREELSRNFAFLEYDKVVVPAAARRAADALMVNGILLFPAGHAEIAAELRLRGISLIEVALDSFAALDDGLAGGIGALSLRLPARAAGNVVAMPLRRQSA